jgi:hypothetical protein
MGGCVTRRLGVQPALLGFGADPYWTSVSLLVGGLADDSSNAFSATLASMTTTGTNPISGSLSLVRTGTTGNLRFPDNAANEFGSGPFTVEGFFKWGTATAPTSGQYHYLINKWTPTGNQRAWNLVWDGDTGKLAFWTTPDGSTATIYASTSAFAPTVNTTYHLAVDYDGTTIRFYQNGALIGSSAATLNLFNGTSAIALLGRPDTAVTNFPAASTSMGDEFRVTKGVARYASNSGFTNFVSGNVFVGWPRS